MIRLTLKPIPPSIAVYLVSPIERITILVVPKGELPPSRGLVHTLTQHLRDERLIEGFLQDQFDAPIIRTLILERISKERFEKILLHRKLHDGLVKSLIPFSANERPAPAGKAAWVNSLYHDVESGEYFPSIPRDYITLNKNRGITRICPQFSYQDTCVYYFCVRQLVDIIASGRVDGTFGGWRGSVPQQILESEEHLADIEPIAELLLLQNYETNSLFDPTRWAKEWGEFQRVIYAKSRSSEHSHFLKIDIANFYDSINLDKLERSLRHSAGSEDLPTIDLLFVLLRNWNRNQEGYGMKTIGIPQNSSEDDCSRILANFYLQPYDRKMRELSVELGFEYVRYSDDQVIMLKNSSMAPLVLNHASIFLYELGLNLNSSKVLEFSNRDDFEFYWVFELLEQLTDKQNRDAIRIGASSFRARVESNDVRPWRYPTIMTRLLTTGVGIIEGADREFLVNEALKPKNFDTLSHRYLRNLDSMVRPGSERKSFEQNIELTISETLFTDRLWHLRKFYGSRITRDIDTRIETRLTRVRPKHG